jgi:hypothetical protein
MQRDNRADPIHFAIQNRLVEWPPRHRIRYRVLAIWGEGRARMGQSAFFLKVHRLKTLWNLVCLAAAVCAPGGLPAAQAQTMKNVLILNSYHPGFKWTDDITRGAVAALHPLKKQTRIFIEYMGTKWVKDELYFRQLRQLLKHKYAGYRFDLIISSATIMKPFTLEALSTALQRLGAL